MLRTVKLYGELADFVGHKELNAVINNTSDAIRFLISNFPKLEAHMASRHYQVLIGDYDIDETELDYPLGKSTLSIVPVVTGAGGRGLGKILLGAALIGLSFTGIFLKPISFSSGIGAGFAAAGLGAKAAFGIGAGLVLSGTADLLFPVPTTPDFANEEDPRISFSFSGVQNVSRAGTSHPICYGEIVCGSVVISAGIDTDQVQA